jgi:hypothetical protein
MEKRVRTLSERKGADRRILQNNKIKTNTKQKINNEMWNQYLYIICRTGGWNRGIGRKTFLGQVQFKALSALFNHSNL